MPWFLPPAEVGQNSSRAFDQGLRTFPVRLTSRKTGRTIGVDRSLGEHRATWSTYSLKIRWLVGGVRGRRRSGSSATHQVAVDSLNDERLSIPQTFLQVALQPGAHSSGVGLIHGHTLLEHARWRTGLVYAQRVAQRTHQGQQGPCEST